MGVTMENKIEEMRNDIHEATRRATAILVEETSAFVKENHHYHSKNDFDKAHTKTLAELEAEYLVEQGYRKQVQGEWQPVMQELNYYDTCKCSVCEFEIDISQTDYKYCPNCSAKMKGAEQ